MDNDFDPIGTLGAPGFQNFNGFIADNEKNVNLAGTQRYITYNNIVTNVPIVSAGVRYFLNLVSKAKWSVVPVDESIEAERVAELIETSLMNMDTPWAKVVRNAAMYRFHGHSVQEWTAMKADNGDIVFKDIQLRPQHTLERWHVDEHGHLEAVEQRIAQTGREVVLPRGKIMYLVDDSLSDSPIGSGLFRHLVGPADKLQRYEQLEGFGFETDLRGIPVATAPLTALAAMVNKGEITAADAMRILKPLQDFVKSHVKNPKLGMVIDSDTYKSQNTAMNPSANKKWGIELLKSGSTGQKEIHTTISRLNHEMARVLGVEQLLLGGEGAGTQALSRDKSQNFFLIIDSVLGEISTSVSKDLIKPILELNGINNQLAPKLVTEAVQFRDIEQITGALRDLALAGAPMGFDDKAINDIRGLLGVSLADLEMQPEGL